MREAKVEAKRKREMEKEVQDKIVRVVRVVPKCRFGGRVGQTDRQTKEK
jgi:hypothetical protein